jgi:hypothetical protein
MRESLDSYKDFLNQYLRTEKWIVSRIYVEE